jgi:hypothetical protein
MYTVCSCSDNSNILLTPSKSYIYRDKVNMTKSDKYTLLQGVKLQIDINKTQNIIKFRKIKLNLNLLYVLAWT